MKTRPFFTAAWRDLLLLNWRVDPALLQPHVPADVKLDPWRGEHFVSVVGFRFLDLAVKGMPAVGHRDFPEINLRFYVQREVRGEIRRGVVFLRELTPRRMGSRGGHAGFGAGADVVANHFPVVAHVKAADGECWVVPRFAGERREAGDFLF